MAYEIDLAKLIQRHNVQQTPAGFWDTFTSSIQVPFIDPQLIASVQFASDPSLSAAENLYNTTGFFDGSQGRARYNWQEVSENPRLFWDWFKQTAGSSFGQQFSPIVAALATKNPTAYGAVATAQYYVNNTKRLASEYMKAVDEGREPVRPDDQLIDTLGVSAFQALLEIAGFKAFGMGKLLGMNGSKVAKSTAKKALTDLDKINKSPSLLRKAAGASLTGAGILGRGVVKGAGIEIPQEVMQTIGERYQAGLPLIGDEAAEEYLEAMVGGFFLGSSIGTTMDVFGKFNRSMRTDPKILEQENKKLSLIEEDLEKPQKQEDKVDLEGLEESNFEYGGRLPDDEVQIKQDIKVKGTTPDISTEVDTQNIEGKIVGTVEGIEETDTFSNVEATGGDLNYDTEDVTPSELKKETTTEKEKDFNEYENSEFKKELDETDASLANLNIEQPAQDLDKEKLDIAIDDDINKDAIDAEDTNKKRKNNPEKYEKATKKLDALQFKGFDPIASAKKSKDVLTLAEKIITDKIDKAQELEEVKQLDKDTSVQTGILRNKLREAYIINPSLNENELGSKVKDLVVTLDDLANSINDIELELKNVYNKELGKSPKLNILPQLVKGLPEITPTILERKIIDKRGETTGIQYTVSGTSPIPQDKIFLPKNIDILFSEENRRKAMAEDKLGRPQLLNLQTKISDYIQTWQSLKAMTDLLRDNPEKIGTGKAEPRESTYVGSYYFRGAVSGQDTTLYRPITPDATTAIQANNLAEAMDNIAKQNPELKKIVEALKRFTGSTGIRYAEVRDTFGERRAAYYDTKDNIITVDPEKGGSPHTILHEATHAATHAILQKGSKHFLVKQIKEIFEESKQFIDPTLYKGAFVFEEKGSKPKYDLEEFVAEFFSNPEFQQSLSEFRYKNTNQTLLDRVVNFVRRLLNLPERGVARLNNLIGQILQESESSPVRRTLFSAAIADGFGGIENMTFNKTDKVIKGGLNLTDKNVNIFNRLKNIPGFKYLKQFQPLTYVLKSVVANTPKKVSDKFSEVYDLIRQKSGYLQTQREQAGLVVKYLQNLKDKNPEAFEAFADLAIKTTEVQVIVADEKGNPLDPSNPKHAELIEKDMAVKKANGLYSEKNTRILRDAYKKLPDPYRKAYAALVNDFKNRFEDYIGVIETDILSMQNINPETKGFIMNIIKRGIDNSTVPAPFLPLRRFGDFRLSIIQKDPSSNPIDGKGYERRVEHFESAADRDKFTVEYRENILENTPTKDRNIILKIFGMMRNYSQEGVSINPQKDFNTAQLDAMPEEQKNAYLDLRSVYNELSSDGKFRFGLFNSPTPFSSYYDLNKIRNDSASFTAPVLAKLEKVFDDANVDRETKEQFFDYAFKHLPDALFGGMIQKRSIPVVQGASRDIINIYRTHTQSMISRQADALFNGAMDRAVDGAREIIRRDAETGQGINYAAGTVEEAQEYLRYLEKATSFAKSPTSSNLANFGTALGFHWFMGFNISSALIQGTNMVGVIYPALGAKYGYGNAISSISKAASIIKNAGLTRTIKDPTGLLGDDRIIDSVSILNYTKEQLSQISKSKGYDSDTLFKLRKTLKEYGQLGRSSEQDLLSPTSRIGPEGRDAKLKDRITGRFMPSLMKASSFLFNLTEQAQREVTALSAFDLAYNKYLKDVKAGKITKQEAYKKAEKDAVDSIEIYNGGISRETAPAFGQEAGGYARLITLFKNYGFFLYSLIFSLLKKSLPKYLGNQYSDQEIATARKTLVGMTGAAYLLGGTKAVPFFFVPEIIYNSFFKDEGEEDFDQLAESIFGESMLDKLFGLKIGQRTGFYQVIFQSPRQESTTLASYFDQLALQALGPLYSGGSNFMKGFDDIANGQFQRGIEKMVPTAASNISKATRLFTEGVVTKRGDTVLEPLGLIPTIANGVGLKTYAVYLSTDVPFNVRKRFQQVDNKKQKYLEQMEHASKMGDVDQYRTAYDKLLRLGEQTITGANGKKAKIRDVFNINPSSISKSMKIRLSKEKPYGMYINPRYKELFTSLIEEKYRERGLRFSDNMLLSD